MRGFRVREALLIVALVALSIGWPLSVSRLVKRADVAEMELGGAFDRAEIAEERLADLTTRLAEAEETADAEIAHRERVEQALADCEGRDSDE